MKIEVKNFGPIKKGQIDLDKRVTVFVGNNNSGKTYMSQFIWGLSNNLWFYLNIVGISVENPNKEYITITKEDFNKRINEFKANIKNSLVPDLFNVKNDYFSTDLFSIVFIDDILGEINKMPFFHYALKSEINRQGIATFSEFFHIEKQENSLKFVIINEKFGEYLSVDEINKKYKINISNNASTFTGEFQAMMHIEICLHLMLNKSIFKYGYQTAFLSANRVFYPSYYKYIYSVSKEEKEQIGVRLHRNDSYESIKALSQSPYTKAMDDLTKKVYELNLNPQIKHYNDDLLNDLKEIIGGDIIIKSLEGIAPIEFYLRLDNGKDLDMYMASSSANQLATLYLYFKFWAEEENNFLIIDEPEENLHPENQIKLVNILIKFADRGNNKILITTHSPLITDHINNYANLSYLNEAKIDMTTQMTENNFTMASIKNIKHADYGVYFFNGDSIQEYEMDKFGAYFEDFQIAEDKVKNISNILREQIFNNRNRNAK